MRAVLLDLDDTLSDHTHSSRLALLEVCRANPGLAARPFATLLADHATILEVIHLEVLRGALTIEAARIERFRRLLTRHGCDGDPASAAACYRDAYQRSRQAVPGALALLEQLRGRAALAIVSNNVQAEQEEKLRYSWAADVLGARAAGVSAVWLNRHGLPCPDPALAHELPSLEPADRVVELLLGGGLSKSTC